MYRRSALCRSALAAVGAMAGLTHGLAWSHGPTDHSKPKGATRKEQKPWGIAGDAQKVTRSVTVRMLDYMRFSPDQLTFRPGETVRLVIDNDDLELHEFVMGTQAEIEEHAALMKKFPNMEHDEPWMVHVPAGGRGEIVWTFNRPGDFVFACLLPRHYEAGMVGKIKVVSSKEK
jgi:uncharacterized cupredoxin-like copper-binding protein